MCFSQNQAETDSGHSFGQVGQRVEFVWEANCLFSASSQKKLFPLLPARLQQPSASWQSLSPKRSKLSMLSDWDTFHDPAQAGKQHFNWFPLSQLTQFAGFWETFYGKEFSSSWCAGHRLCGLCSQCHQPQRRCLGSHASMRWKQDVIWDGATGTAWLGSQVDIVPQQSTNLTSSQVPCIWAWVRGQSLQVKGAKHYGWEEQSPQSITYLLISILYLAPGCCSGWNPINTNDR